MVKDKIKELTNLSFKAKNTKDEIEKNKLEEEVKNILNNLKKGAIESFKNESDLKKFLDNIINFNNYSFGNLCLIWSQKEDATYVASLTTFNKMGYKLKDGEFDKCINIITPSFLTFVKVDIDEKSSEIKPLYMLNEEQMKKYRDKSDNSITFHSKKLSYFSTGYVYDATQTDMPLDEIEKRLNPVLEDPRADGISDTLIKCIYKDGFKVRYDDIESGAKGYCDFENKEIVIKNGLNNLMKLKVLVHEYAHSLAHKHLEENKKEYKEHREQYESEAESIAYVVSKYLGLETKDYSHMYLYSWSRNKDFKEIDDSFNTIINYSKKIINNYEKFMDISFDDLNVQNVVI